MTREEVLNIDSVFDPFISPDNKMKIFHNKESGETIVIIYNPNILGITKLKDLLTLSAEALRNLVLYFKTRDYELLITILKTFRTIKS